jgi:hypothetical protein
MESRRPPNSLPIDIHGAQKLQQLLTNQIGGFVLYPMTNVVEFETPYRPVRI